ncbi:MAG: peptidylprolyl isomerase [Pseudomonadota bacterium]|jgi:FKBP-type peptidyl-prolyl cis-trans isomerase SlyD|nr:MAG: peptidylprolyl isomerase [Pseudomonadota bacterium]
MKIAQDSVVSFHYTLKDAAGAVIDQSDGEPLAYLHGYGQIVPGLERELTGKSTGEKLHVHVLPADGYGEYDAARVLKVPREALSAIPDLQEGMTLTARTRSGGHLEVLVTEIGPEAVTVDGNHPLAGKDLFFDVEIVAVREASEEELAHQHVHGPGGHHH